MKRVFDLRTGAVLLLSMVLSSCALMYRDLEEPEVRLMSVAPQQISFSGVKLLCRLRIDNPNDVSIPVKGGQFALEVEGLQVARGALIDGFTVAAHGRELVDVIVDVNSGSSIALAVQLLGNGAREINYALTGHIDVAISVLGRVQINETGRVPLTSKPAVGGSTI